MRKQFCNKCHSKPACKRVCRIVDAELTSKGILKCDRQTDLPTHSKSIKTIRESDLEGPQAATWMNIAYAAYSDPYE